MFWKFLVRHILPLVIAELLPLIKKEIYNAAKESFPRPE